jgi:hypothetical protein
VGTNPSWRERAPGLLIYQEFSFSLRVETPGKKEILEETLYQAGGRPARDHGTLARQEDLLEIPAEVMIVSSREDATEDEMPDYSDVKSSHKEITK